ANAGGYLQCGDRLQRRHRVRFGAAAPRGRRQGRHRMTPDRSGERLVEAAMTTLPPEIERQLAEDGFAVVPGPTAGEDGARLSDAYDRAVATAHPDDVRVSSSTRVSDFVNRGPAFDAFYVYGPVLAAASAIIGRPFKLST